MANTTTTVNEYYYAMIPASKNESGTGDLFFWTSNTACRGIPGNYGWSPRPEDAVHGYRRNKGDLIEVLVNTLALDIARGDWSIDEATAVEIRKVTEHIVKTTEEKVDPTAKVTEAALIEVGNEKYGWNYHEETT